MQNFDMYKDTLSFLGESHGCPYRHSDPEALRSILAKNGVEGEDLSEILQV